MKTRNFLLGAATGFVAGYAAYRACEAAASLLNPPGAVAPDAKTYGMTRRSLTMAGLARSLAAGAASAFGPAAKSMERAVDGVPVWLRSPLFAAQVSLLEAILELPVDFVEGHELERRYGLSTQPAASWFSDYCKQQAIGTGVTVVLSGLLAAALRTWPKKWPYIASAATFPLLLLANVVIPVYVLPLFNKYEPLEGPLEERLRALASRYGVGDADILRVDMSKQTKKANAFVIGIFGTHRIVVGDTLVDHFTPEEIEFVVAHELGHYVSRDTWRMMAAAQLSATAVIFGAFAALGEPKPKHMRRPRTLAKIQFTAVALTQILRPALAAFSRSREWAADRFALSATNAPRTGAAAFRRLRDQNLAEDEQPAWFEFLFSTHPSLKARIAALESLSAFSPP